MFEPENIKNIKIMEYLLMKVKGLGEANSKREAIGAACSRLK